MKSMRHIALTALLTVGVFSMVTYTSCSKDDKTCPSGFSGSDCTTAWTASYIGLWTATEGTSSYPVTITGGTGPTDLLINNLGNYICSSSGTITFNGVLSSATGFTVTDNQCSTQMNANGTLNTANNTITVSYTASYTLNGQPVTDNFTATLHH